jgi:AcrR family transcriptional regulator
LIEAALSRLCAGGAAQVHPKEICETLGLSKALVNYHFGGRDGLIAEALVRGYERYVDQLVGAAASAGEDPLEQVLAWVNCQIDWTLANPGLLAISSFPTELAGLSPREQADALGRLRAARDRQAASLAALVEAARRQACARRGATVPGPDETAIDAAVVDWTALGASLWSVVATDSTPLPAGRELARHQVVVQLRDLLSR